MWICGHDRSLQDMSYNLTDMYFWSKPICCPPLNYLISLVSFFLLSLSAPTIFYYKLLFFKKGFKHTTLPDFWSIKDHYQGTALVEILPRWSTIIQDSGLAISCKCEIQFQPFAARLYTVFQTSQAESDRPSTSGPLGVRGHDWGCSSCREILLCLILFNELSKTALKCYSLNTLSWEGSDALISCFLTTIYEYVYVCVFESEYSLEKYLLDMSEYMFVN